MRARRAKDARDGEQWRSVRVAERCVALLVLSASACALDPPIDERPWALTIAEDRNPDPGIVEVELRAAGTSIELLPGLQTEMWTYNGLFPGPLIEARVGDRVIVHARNDLDEPTTIHWHGLRIPAEMDGVPAMQSPILPGETFSYDFIVPDALLAWYHPHVRADVQVERGLQAAFLVRAADEPAFGKETIVVLDDVLLDGDGRLAPFADSADSHMTEMRGRLGNTILVNGRRRPVLEVRRGERQLLRVVNTSNARTMALRLPGRPLTWVGTDGGLLESPRTVDALAVSPGERADLLFTIDEAPGATLDLEVLTAPDSMMGGELTTSDLGSEALAGGRKALHIVVVDGEAQAFAALPATLARVPTLSTEGRQRILQFTGGMMGGGMMGGGSATSSGSSGFRINGEQWPEVTLLEAAVGDVEIWTLDNRTGMGHPFHLHGHRFQVLSGPGASLPRAWKDNVHVPARARVTLAVSFDGAPGHWMYHCHILEHAEGGMMGAVMLAP
jgi:FtsP/CotA-like multicopper oxidase with cupredoxin domain